MGEIQYLCILLGIPEDWLRAWCVISCMDPMACVQDRSKLAIEFRSLRKNSLYSNSFCKNEQGFRSKHVPAVTYRFLVAFGFETDFFYKTFAILTLSCGRLEVHSWFIADISPLFEYRMREFMNSDAPWCILAHQDGGQDSYVHTLRGVRFLSSFGTMSENDLKEFVA